MPQAKKRGRGRPKVKRNEEHAKQIEAMSQYGVPQEDMAATIGICVESMLKLYNAEHRRGKARANTNVGRRLYEKCVAGDTTALIFWAKTQMGWKETQRIENYTAGAAENEQKALAAKDRLKAIRAERQAQAADTTGEESQ